MKLTSELQCSQLAELIYLECLKRGIKLAEDESDRENILESSAEYLLYEGSLKDPREIVDRVEKYVTETAQNYPLYFEKGVE